MSKSILVLGATGKQGGAVITNLLKDSSSNNDFEILALTRNTTSPSAQRLAQKSPKIKLVQGDQSDAPALFASAQKASSSDQIWGVFSVQAVNGTTEETQGKAIVDAALSAGVKFFVFSSVDRHGDKSLENPTDVPHFITKHNVEKHLIAKAKGSQMQYTILRPVGFMDNLENNFMGKMFSTAFKIALHGKPLQLVAVTDIGFFAAAAFKEPEEWAGKAVSLAGDDITYEQMKDTFEKQTGQGIPLTYEFVAKIVMYLVKEFGYMFTWFREVGYAADIKSLRAMNPELKDFKTWLATESQWAASRT